MAERFDVLIVGAGHAGAMAAIGLRQRGHAGAIALIGDEPDLPYERPPLSKEYLAGERAFERLLIRPAGFWAERDIAVVTGARVVHVDPVAHRVRTADGASIGYGTLVWAAGGRPRRLACAGGDLVRVQPIRTRGDVDRLRAALPHVSRVVVIGGGYIGLEAAAVLATAGRHVTVVEREGRVLARVAGEPLSRFFEDSHRAHGVDIRLGATVAGIEGAGGRATAVTLGDGDVLPADLVIVGIGIEPAVAPLIAAGAGGGNGVLVDQYCATTLRGIFAIGDCAAHPNRFADGAVVRIESVQNANDQAAVVAGVLTGDASPYAATPWFWSNQYGLKLQTVGLSAGHDDTIVRGDPATGSFSVLYRHAGRVIAIDCVNMVRDYVQGRALVERGSRAAPAVLADAGRALKTVPD